MPTSTITPIQRRFLQWISQQKGISLREATARYSKSVRMFRDGHGGSSYRSFCNLSYTTHQIFHGDNPAELAESYKFHGELHFLRMLSYPSPDPAFAPKILKLLPPTGRVKILDYGCGLAQVSTNIADYIAGENIAVSLYLADLPTCRTAFLQWDARQKDYQTKFISCPADAPATRLPRCSLILATEFLEHVYRPELFMNAFDHALLPGGILITNVTRHKAEYMHVSPNLTGIARRLVAMGYAQMAPLIWRKKAASPPREAIDSS